MRLSWNNFTLDFSIKTYVMGILNITPDSFSDGGLYLDYEKAINRAQEMVHDGADIIDIGGLSTRPGSIPVEPEEEIKRTIPIIEALSMKIKVPISIDTYRAVVAKEALNAGASMINDISGMNFDPEMPSVAAKSDVPVILMHIKGTPLDMQTDPQYVALIPEIMDYLRKCISVAKNAGIDKIIIDPGIGFGKTFKHNLSIINNLNEFAMLGYPLLVGPSRKAFLGKILDNAPPLERLEGTIAAVTACVLRGANIVRVHDVKEITKALKVTNAIKKEIVNTI